MEKSGCTVHCRERGREEVGTDHTPSDLYFRSSTITLNLVRVGKLDHTRKGKEMGFELFCATMIAIILGLVICFAGYRLFLVLLPIWGFFFGFALGAQTLQALFGMGFLSTVTSWVVGFFVGAIFGLLSYLFYAVAVALVAGGLGYALGAGFMGLIGLDWNWLVWLVGIIVGIAVVIVTFYFNLQKYVIIAATAIGGAAVIVGTLMFGVTGMAFSRLFENPVRVMLQDRPIWTIIFLIVAVAGIALQILMTRAWEIEPYENRI